MKIYKINGKCSTMQVTCISQFIKSYYLKFSNFSLGISKNLEGLYVSLLLMNLPLINNDNWTEWSQFWSEIVLMISSKTPTPCSFDLKIMHFHLCRFTWFAHAFWDKSAQANFSKANQIAWASRVSAISSLWKTLEFWFIPNFTSKIMWLLVNNIQAKIFLFFSL